MITEKLIATLQDIFPEGTKERIFLVGGTVRDALLGRPQKDIDLLIALPEETLQTCGFRRVVGKSTAPIWFRTDRDLGTIEVTTLASPELVEQELARRDFTINALAVSLSGQLHDPLKGRQDLAKRQLRVCSPSCFSDDPLRIFRALRFEAGGWQLTSESERLIIEQDWEQPLAAIPVERFSREFVKALSADQPIRFIEGMLRWKVGTHWLPELFAMTQVPAGPAEQHPEGDLANHSLQVLQRIALLTPDPLARFCGLFHDLGKLHTDPANHPRHHGHDEAGFVPAIELCNRLRLPASFRTALAWTNCLHTRMNRWSELRDATRLRLAEHASKAGIASILPLVSQADKTGSVAPLGWGQVLTITQLTTADLGIDISMLEAVQPKQRSSLVLNSRIEALRAGRVVSDRT